MSDPTKLSGSEVARLLATALRADANEELSPVQGIEIVREERARCALRLYAATAPLFPKSPHDDANAASLALGIVIEIADYYALATLDWPQDAPIYACFPRFAAVRANIVDLELDKWARDLGVELPLEDAATRVAGGHVKGAEAVFQSLTVKPTPGLDPDTREIAVRLLKTFIQIAEIYREGLRAATMPHGPIELQSEKMRSAAAGQIAEARLLVAAAIQRMGPPVQMICAGVMHISRGFFNLAWSGGSTFPTVEFLRALISDHDSRELFDTYRVQLPAWLQPEGEASS